MAATLEDLGQDQINELALLARELSDNPDTRPDFLRGMKKIRPGTPVPELELDDRLAAARKENTDALAALQNKLAERDLRDELTRRRTAIKTERNLSDTDVEAIEKVMLDKGIQNHEAAADYWDWMRQAAKPTPAAYDRSFLNKENRTVLSDYWKNPAAAARANAADAINDFKKQNRIG
jgi:hypothetical protein